MVYADTSALIKLFLPERGSELVRDLLDSEALTLTSTVTRVELTAAVCRAWREGRIAAADRAEIDSRITVLWNQLASSSPDDEVFQRAAELSCSFALRTYDAIQLASLEAAGGPDDIRFLCADRQLRRAATDLGYRLVPAELD